jgi:hypothetical protein
MRKLDENGLSKYQRKVLEREGKYPPKRRLDFVLVSPCMNPDLWESLYDGGGATFERMDDGKVWLNSTNEILGPVVIYRETHEYEGDTQIVELTLYNNGREVAQTEIFEPKDWYSGPFEAVTAFARENLTETRVV